MLISNFLTSHNCNELKSFCSVGLGNLNGPEFGSTKLYILSIKYGLFGCHLFPFSKEFFLTVQ